MAHLTHPIERAPARHRHPLLRGRWLLAHLLVLAAVPLMLSLGCWQLRRLSERRQRNAAIAARLALPPVALAAATTIDPQALGYRRVRATGIYENGASVALRGQSLNGVAGLHLLTPLRLRDGRAVLVDRGWVPLTARNPVSWAHSAQAGTVAVDGIAHPSQPLTGWLATMDRFPSGAQRIAVWSRVDLDRIQRQVKEPLLPIYIAELTRPEQRPGRFPQPVAGPPTDEGPHAGYAAQWFSFALITSAGYALGIRRAMRSGHVAGLRQAAMADQRHDQLLR